MTKPLDMALRCQKTFASLGVGASLTEKYFILIYYLIDVLEMSEELVWKFIGGDMTEDVFLGLVEHQKKTAVKQSGIIRFWMTIVKAIPGVLSDDELAYLIQDKAGEIKAIWDLLDAMYGYGVSPDIFKYFVRTVKIR